ncbi:MAG: DUF2332 domain-containing protein [Nocardioidaceae bacterium]
MEVVQAVRRQAQACAELGSPMYADLLTRLAAELDAGGATAEMLAAYEDDPADFLLALRLLGSVHRLVLDGSAPDLARYYPSVGGAWRPDAGWRAFGATLREHQNAVRARLHQAPQTNDVGRSAALMGGLLHLVAAHPLPVRLHEIGASGGLNLLPDRYCYLYGPHVAYGPRDSPVRLAGAWTGRRPPDVDVEVVSRLGCDLAPADVATPEGRLTLTSYVWPDQVERIDRLRAALRVAQVWPVEVRRQDAVTFVDRLDLVDDTVTVLWHSLLWQYLPEPQQREVAARIEQLGAQATDRRVFAHLMFEPQRRSADSQDAPDSPDSPVEFLVVLRVWPGGERRVLAEAAPHGIPTVWE